MSDPPTVHPEPSACSTPRRDTTEIDRVQQAPSNRWVVTSTGDGSRVVAVVRRRVFDTHPIPVSPSPRVRGTDHPQSRAAVAAPESSSWGRRRGRDPVLGSRGPVLGPSRGACHRHCHYERVRRGPTTAWIVRSAGVPAVAHPKATAVPTPRAADCRAECVRRRGNTAFRVAWGSQRWRIPPSASDQTGEDAFSSITGRFRGGRRRSRVVTIPLRRRGSVQDLNTGTNGQKLTAESVSLS